MRILPLALCEIYRHNIGSMAAPMPSKYVAGPFVQYSAQPGGALLLESPTSDMARPKIPVSGGRRKSSRHVKRKHMSRKHKSHSGGFIPSIGEGFAAAAAKYITPIALYGLYRFIGNKKGSTRHSSHSSHSRRTRRTRRRHHRV